MRYKGTLAATFLLMGAVGCSSSVKESRQCFNSIEQGRPLELASALLFNPRPGGINPEYFAQRSEWPSTPSYYSPGQVIFWSDRMVDYQGRSWGSSWGTYRRADSVRVGVGYRP